MMTRAIRDEAGLMADKIRICSQLRAHITTTAIAPAAAAAAAAAAAMLLLLLFRHSEGVD